MLAPDMRRTVLYPTSQISVCAKPKSLDKGVMEGIMLQHEKRATLPDILNCFIPHSANKLAIKASGRQSNKAHYRFKEGTLHLERSGYVSDGIIYDVLPAAKLRLLTHILTSNSSRARTSEDNARELQAVLDCRRW